MIAEEISLLLHLALCTFYCGLIILRCQNFVNTSNKLFYRGIIKFYYF